MNYRQLGRTGMKVSEVSFGAWAIGGTWGTVDDAESLAALHKAVDLGINFFDTADVYGDGRSERLIAQLRRERAGETIYVATKAGRRLPTQTVEGYSRENLNSFVDRSLTNLQMETVDLLQLHCPPTAAYRRAEIYAILDDMVRAGKIRYYGVSVELVEEALAAMEFAGMQSVQIIFNLFRMKPAEKFFPAAKAKRVGILARVPLASGLLTGKIRKDTQFEADDHRRFNRHGEAFDMGETFSGVDLDAGLAAVEELRGLVPGGASMAQFALRWILMFDAVSCVIPGGKRARQVSDNVGAGELAELSSGVMEKAREIYDRRIRPLVHSRW